MPSEKALCPSVGYHPFVDDHCGPAFVKCTRRAKNSNELEGTVYKCPEGYAYWSVSRRCERSEKLPNCQKSRLYGINGLPTEWVNLGKARKLRI